MNWNQILTDSHELNDSFCGETSRLEFICENIFNLSLYDGEQTEKIGRKFIEVINAITTGTTFEYIKDAENYTWFLMVCNLKCIADKLSWGSSIRGAGWDTPHYKKQKIEFQSCALVNESGEQETEWEFTVDEWKEFMLALVEYADLD